MKKIFTSQWSFLWAGIAFGIAQLIYMIGMMVPSWMHDKTPKVAPMTVTSDLGRMFRSLEVWVTNLFGFSDAQIYGSSKLIDGNVVNSGGAFIPGIGWVIVGMIVGGFIASRAEKESRTWAHYSKAMLITSFIGGVIFSYGTRLAGGCTLNHLLGGVPMMSLHSLVAIAFMTMGGLSAFLLMGKLGLAGNFKHQSTLAYSKMSFEKGNLGECLDYKPDYKPRKNPMLWIGLGFLSLFVLIAVYGAIFEPSYFHSIAKGKSVLFNKGISHAGWLYAFLIISAGILAGFGMAKSGFGTECALVSAEASMMIKKDEKKFIKLGLPKITRTLFKGLLPLQGVIAAWIITLGGIIIFWGLLGYKHGFTGSIKYQLTAGVPIGGFLLGAGAVLLIGCEIRSYMRLGMGYLNTLVGFMGFAIGYLPFTLFYEGHKAFFKNTLILKEYTWLELISKSHSVQVIVAVVFLALLVFLLRFVIKQGAKNTLVPVSSIMNKNTEELQVEINSAKTTTAQETPEDLKLELNTAN